MKRKIKLVEESFDPYNINEGTQGWEETRAGENFIERLMDELQDLGLTWEEADFAILQVDDWQMDMWIYELNYGSESITNIANEVKKIAFGGKEIFEFAKRRGRPRKRSAGIDAPDEWGADDDEFDVDVMEPDSVENVELTPEEEEELKFYEKLKKILRNELTSPEFNRGFVAFKIRNTGEKVKGIPMAELKDAFLFKINGNLRKVKLTDMIIL